MRLWRVSSVLVLIVFASILVASAWVSGCAGFAEPLPQLSVTPNSLSVSATVGNASSQVVTVANIGSATIGISQANVIGAGFSVAGLRLPLVLSPGQGANFSVKFVPSSASSVDGSLSLVTDANHRPIVLQLHGKAAPANAPVTSVALSPASASPAVNSRVQFTATVQGTTADHSVTWSATIGTITSIGLFTAPASASTGVVTATSVADPTRSASAPVTVTVVPNPNPNPNPPPPGPAVTSVTISPVSAKSATGGTLSFTASVQGSTSNKSVTWSASLGSITPSGLYTAPASAGTATVTATSVADTTKSASATVTVTAAPTAPTPVVTSVTISPNSASSTTGETLQFTAAVQGSASDKSVRWNAALGSITSSGLYTAPAHAGTDTVTATSNADSSKAGSAVVTVTVPQPSGGLPAFPGAQGGGAAAVGGRGGVVLEVTNLNDSGAGSLRACVEASGPRTCVFRVAGIIHPTHRLGAANPFLTVAGQTAPGGGITISGDQMNGDSMLWSESHDQVWRYLTVRVGNGPGHTPGPATGSSCMEQASGTVYNVVFDHITCSWWDNKSWITYSNQSPAVQNTTLQWSLMYEGNAAHSVGPMADASELADSVVDLDFHHNFVGTSSHRLPLINIKRIRWVSNIVWNYDYYVSLAQGGVTADYVNNKYASGNLNSGDSFHELEFNPSASPDVNGSLSGTPSPYLVGNVGPHNSTVTTVPNDSGQMAMTCTGTEAGDSSPCPADRTWFRSSPLAAEPFPITADSVNGLDSIIVSTVGNSKMIDCAGTLVKRRDSLDSAFLAKYQANAADSYFTTYDSDHPQFPAIAAGSACVESVHDGIPDQWKQLKGLSTTDPNLYKTTAPNGYTWLENYINGE